MPALLGVAMATSATLLAWGLTEHAKYPSDEAIQVPVLMALVPPTISAATMHYLGKAIAPLWAQWVLATLAWALGLLVTGLTALYLNWITI